MLSPVNKQEAQIEATRETLRALVKASPYTTKYIAQQVGEEYTSYVHRLKGTRASFHKLDTALVVNTLAVLDVPISEFFTQVERRAEEILRRQS